MAMASFIISSEVTIQSNVFNCYDLNTVADSSANHEHAKMSMNTNYLPVLGSSLNRSFISSNENSNSNDFISHDITSNNVQETVYQTKSVEFNPEEVNQLFTDLNKTFPDAFEQVVFEYRNSPLLNPNESNDFVAALSANQSSASENISTFNLVGDVIDMNTNLISDPVLSLEDLYNALPANLTNWSINEIGVENHQNHQFQNSSQVYNVDIETPIAENGVFKYQQEFVMDQPMQYVNLNTAQQTFVPSDFEFRQPLSNSTSEMSPSASIHHFSDESNCSMSSSSSPSSSSSSKPGSPKSSISISYPMHILPKRRDSNRISRYQRIGFNSTPKSPKRLVKQEKSTKIIKKSRECYHILDYINEIFYNPNKLYQRLIERDPKKLMELEKEGLKLDDLLHWLDEEKGIFQVLQLDFVSYIWSLVKNNKHWCWKNFTKAIRSAKDARGDFEIVKKEEGYGKWHILKMNRKF